MPVSTMSSMSFYVYVFLCLRLPCLSTPPMYLYACIYICHIIPCTCLHQYLGILLLASKIWFLVYLWARQTPQFREVQVSLILIETSIINMATSMPPMTYRTYLPPYHQPLTYNLLQHSTKFTSSPTSLYLVSTSSLWSLLSLYHQCPRWLPLSYHSCYHSYHSCYHCPTTVLPMSTTVLPCPTCSLLKSYCVLLKCY